MFELLKNKFVPLGTAKFTVRPLGVFQHLEGWFLGRSSQGRVVWFSDKIHVSQTKICSSDWDINTRRYREVFAIFHWHTETV